MADQVSRKWWALVLLGAVQFMVVLDVSIVNVALPSIQHALHFSEANLQWVVNAYTLMFGGFLLLGGRVADELGRRRLFIAGLALFSTASLVCGLAPSAGALIAARAVQGLGAAIVSPAALSILTTTFREGRERNTALGVWGAIAGAGGAAGVLLGGVLTTELSWTWIFFINVPIGALAIAVAPALLVNTRARTGRGFDVAGAVSVTGGLLLLVFGLVKANSYGWASARTAGILAGAAVLLAVFVAVEMRSRNPLIPLGIFRRRTITGANAVGLLIGAAIFSMFFFLSLYMQEVEHYSALRSGLYYLGVAIPIILAAVVAQSVVTRVGVARVLVVGLALSTAGLVWFTRLPLHGSYAADLLPGFVLAGVGLGLSFVPVTIAAISGITSREAGIASGLINTSQQVGGALGVAVLLAVSLSEVTGYLHGHHGAGASAAASLAGYHSAFLVGAILTGLGIVMTLLLLRRLPAVAGVDQPVPAARRPEDAALPAAPAAVDPG